ncbi:MAG: cysteine desulfurase [Armatimonadetes bacterium]|nr:cysteine desulfurase [Armatimonadota bacterium]
MKKRIYLDYAATSPMLAEAREAMVPWLDCSFGNPSSIYAEGREAKHAIDTARDAVSSALGCRFGEVTFTSGGTESANAAMIGVALANKNAQRDTVLMSAAEHHCVLETASVLTRLGLQVKTIPVTAKSVVEPSAVESALTDRTLIVSVMHANNETGALNDARAIADLARASGALYHCDAVQTFPWFNGSACKAEEIGADLISISAHKMGGPKGIGALYVRAGTDTKSVIVGGGQERDSRAGTENVPGIVGFGAAVDASVKTGCQSVAKKAARSKFLEELQRLSPIEFEQIAAGVETLAGHAHLRFPGVRAETLLIRLDRDGVAASSGSACSSGGLNPSHVMLACGLTREQAAECVRFTFSGGTTTDAAATAGAIVAKALTEILSKRA